MKKLFVGFISLLLGVSHSTVAFAGSDEMSMTSFQFTPENSLGHLGYLAYPRSSGLNVRDPFLLGMTLDAGGKPTTVKLCKSIDDSNCKDQTDFTVASILPECETSEASDCLRDFTAQSPDGKNFEIIKIGSFAEDAPNRFVGDAKLAIPSGVSPTLYRIPEAPHEAGDLYLVIASRSGHWNRSASRMTEFDNTSVSIYAVKISEGSFQIFEPSVDASEYGSKYSINTRGGDSRCIFNSRTKCAEAFALPTNVRFGVKVSYSQLGQKWFHGRVNAPQVKVVTESSGTLVDISAFAVRSTGFFVLKKRTELPSYLIEEENGKLGRGNCTGSGLENSCYDSNFWQTSKDMKDFLAWLQVAGDKATFDPTSWSINAMNQNLEHPRATLCSPQNGQLVGFVSTNATQYIAGPPAFNSVTSELEYQVAAPHLRSDGTVFRGSYDLAMDATYAACIYQLEGSVVKASISVSSNGGELIAATTSQNERDGWLYLSAKDFTFSSPTIKVKLGKDPEEKPVVINKNDGATGKKKTIRCAKGKKVKLVQSVKCPKGYKKA